MAEQPLWYHQTTNDPIVRAQAFAAAGVLAAARWDPRHERAEDYLEKLIASEGSNLIPWRHPSTLAPSPADLTDEHLAHAWVRSLERAKSGHAARLLVDAWEAHDLVAVTRELTDPWMTEIGDAFPLGSVMSVSFATPGAMPNHEWQWPLRIDTRGTLADAIRAVRAADKSKYAFLDIVSPEAPAAELAVLPAEGPQSLILGQRKLGMALLSAPTALERNHLLDLARQSLTLSHRFSFPMAVIDSRDDLPLWVNEFTFALSHNKSLDEAVFDAHRGVRVMEMRRGGFVRRRNPPLLFAAKAGIHDVLGGVRLQNRVPELIARIEQLPHDLALGAPPEGASALGIGSDARTAGDYAGALREAVASGNLDFSRESKGARVYTEINARIPGPGTARASTTSRAASAGPRSPSPAAAEDVPRYTDVVFYEGRHFSEDDLKGARRLPDSEPLLGSGEYTLEVAIRAKRIGVSAEDRRAPPVKDPRKEKEDVRIYVFVTSSWRDLKIDKAFTAITWPHGADSQSAIFRLDMAALDKVSKGIIEVRLYSAAMDLLDIVEVVAGARPAGVLARLRRRPPGRSLRWPAGKAASVTPDPVTVPRLLSIHVSPDGQGFLFEFKVLTADRSAIKVPARRAVTTQDVEQLLIRIRNFWTRLVVTNYADQLTVTRSTYGDYLKDLARLGENAWTLLFGDRYDAQPGASQALGELLAAAPAADGHRIQVTHAVTLPGFIFPWNVLYPPRQSSDDVDPLAFWGARYEIEQVREGSRELNLGDEPVQISFALDPAFGNSGLQRELFLGLAKSGKGKLTVTKPISDENALFAELLQSPAAHLFYFYGHGYVPAGPGVIRYDGVKELTRQIELLAEGSPERRALETLLGLTAKMGDEPWMFIGNSQIKESTFQNRKFFERRQSIVFLNMCNSADLAPSISSGFVRLFLQHNASAVIGTECPMTSVFAHEFAKVFFKALLSGASIGAAVLRARREFLASDRRNPLGLAYTLYGRADARLGRGPVIS